MAVIAIYSLKGGVGKTSLAVNLAWSSAAAGHATLLWDLDPQWAASFLLGHAPERATSANRLFTADVASGDLVLWTGIDNLDLLPADASLRGLDGYFASSGKKRRMAKLAARLRDDYPRIILDCPPGLTETTDQMMRTADLIVVPVIPSPLSQRALEDVRAHLLERHGGHVPILPVFAMVDRRRALHRAALEANPGWPAIPMASAVERMAAERSPVQGFAASSPAAQACDALWRGIDRKISGLAA